MKLDYKYIRHLALVVLNGAEQSALITNILRQLRVRYVLANSHHEALRLLDQELPHIIICDEKYSDGSASELLAAMHRDKLFSRTPCLVLSSDNIPGGNSSFNDESGLISRFYYRPRLIPDQLANKIEAMLIGLQEKSPFFVDREALNFASNIRLHLAANVIGVNEDFIIAYSRNRLAQCPAIKCHIHGFRTPIILGKPFERKVDQYWIHLFPLRVLRSSAVLVKQHLRMIADESDQLEQDPKPTILIDDNPTRAQMISTALREFGIEMRVCPSLTQAIDMFERADTYQDLVVWTPSDSKKIEQMRLTIATMTKQTPTLFIISEKNHRHSQQDHSTIQIPPRLGDLVLALKASSTDFAKIHQTALQGESRGLTPAEFEINATVEGIDEMGIVVTTRANLGKDCKVRISGNKLFAMLFEGSTLQAMQGAPTERGYSSHLYLNEAATSKRKRLERNLATIKHFTTNDSELAARFTNF